MCINRSMYSYEKHFLFIKMIDMILLLTKICFQANYFRATQYCRFHGMHLASITSQEENDKLEKYIKDFGMLHL